MCMTVSKYVAAFRNIHDKNIRPKTPVLLAASSPSNRSTLIRRALSSVSIALLAFSASSAPAFAKKKKPPEVLPCPVDGPLIVANVEDSKIFKSLEGCKDQLVDSPPDPPQEAPEPLEIEGENESPYISNMDEARPSKGKTRRAGGRKGASERSDSGNGIYMLTSPGGVRSLRIVPEQQEIDYRTTYGDQSGGMLPAPPGAVSASASTSVKDNPEAILGLRPGTYATRFDDLIEQVARRHRIDPLFLHAVIKQESGYKPGVGSHAGAVGLMQIMPATGRSLGLHPAQRTDPAANVDAGARLLKKLHRKYNGNFELMLAGYNAGEGAVQKYGNRVPPYRETQNYVKVIMAHYRQLVATARTNGGASAK
jgi:hypothetical protein